MKTNRGNFKTSLATALTVALVCGNTTLPALAQATNPPSPSVPTAPTQDQALVDMAQAALDSQDFQTAFDDCNKAISQNPANEKAYVLRAVAEYQLNMPLASSIADLNQALSITPTDTDALSGRGFLEAQVHDYKAAIADFGAVLAVNPSDQDVLTEKISVEMTIDDSKDLVTDLTTQISLTPDDGVAYYNRGISEKHLGETTQAVSDFQTASKLFLSQKDQDDYKMAQDEIKSMQNTTT